MWHLLVVAVLLTFGSDIELKTRVHAAQLQLEEFIIDTWETKDGLPENSATAMVQTGDGYLWFGTFNGLVRFDGVRFEVYNPKNTAELPGAGIVNLHLDRSDRLWVSTLDGLVMRDDTGWRRFGPADGWNDADVRAFAESNDGALLFSTFEGQLREWSDGRFRELPLPSNENGEVMCASDGKGRWWVTFQDLVAFWDGVQWTTVLQPSADLRGRGCAPSRDGGIWVIIGKTLRKYNGMVEVVRHDIPEMPAGIWHIFEDSKGHVWVATHDEGVSRVSPDSLLRHWGYTSGLGHDSTRFVFEDREQNIWIGTNGGGLSRFKIRRAKTYGREHGIAEPVVKSVWPSSDGSVLSGTNGGGLFRLTGDGAQHIRLPVGEKSASYVHSVLQDRTGRIWIGTYEEGLFLIDGTGTHQFAPEILGKKTVPALFEDSRGRLWVSSGNRVAVVEEGVVRVLKTSVGTSIRDACAFGEFEDGTILMSDQKGVFKVVQDC